MPAVAAVEEEEDVRLERFLQAAAADFDNAISCNS